MTTTPHPHRRRATGIRRPRVAGHTAGKPAPAAPPDDPVLPDPAASARAASDPAAPDTAASDTADAAPPAADGHTAVGAAQERRPTGKRTRRRRASGGAATPARRRPLPLPALAAALVLLVGLAVFFAVENADVRDTPAARNTALVDIGTTAQVSQQITAALKTVYSFDYTRLDQNEAAARAVITPSFADQFDQLFRQVRELAPQQQAVVTATVNLVGVRSIDGDTATVLVFLDQQATRAQAGDGPQQLAAGRLTVTAQRSDGVWKIAAVDPR